MRIRASEHEDIATQMLKLRIELFLARTSTSPAISGSGRNL